MALYVVERMDTFVGADRDGAGRGRDRRHAEEIMRLDRLLEEVEPGAFHRADIRNRLLGAEALIGVGGDQQTAAQQFAYRAGADGVYFRAIDADLDLVGGEA